MATPEAIAVRDPQQLASRYEFSVEEIIAQAQKIEDVMKRAMKEDVHYGTIPGTPKPTLYKAGAEKLLLLFRLDPQYHSTENYEEGGHLIVKSVCTLYHITTGQRFGSGEGSCSTRESKYAWRFSKRACPSCGAEAIGKSKAEFGGGWYCNKKAGGCGDGFKPGSEGAKAIEAQREVGKIPNPDIADQYNTVLKMANKRALVAAVLNCTAASDVFTQDLEDEDEAGADEAKRQEPRGQGSRPQQQQQGGGQQRQQDPDATITENQLKRFHAIANGKKWTAEQKHELLTSFGYDSSEHIKSKDYESIVDYVKDTYERWREGQAKKAAEAAA